MTVTHLTPYTDIMEDEFPQLLLFEINDRLEVMRRQEETTYSCSDYLNETVKTTKMIDQLCRQKMLKWCFQVVDFAQFKRETVVIAMSYLDQFLSSGSPRAIDAIKNRKGYQLASMTTLYMAIKLFEPIEMTPSIFATLSRDSYTSKDFTKMETDILSALNWRLNGPTVLSFLEHFFALIPHGISGSPTAWKKLLSYSKHYVELTLGDHYFVTENPSTVAISCISTGMKHIPSSLLNETDRRSFFSSIVSISKVDLFSFELKTTRQRMSALCCKSPQIESKPQTLIPSKPDEYSTMTSSNPAGNLSPVCVSRKKVKHSILERNI